jgi:hypothetical protein
MALAWHGLLLWGQLGLISQEYIAKNILIELKLFALVLVVISKELIIQKVRMSNIAKNFIISILLIINNCGFEAIYRDDIKNNDKIKISDIGQELINNIKNDASNNDKISFYQKELSAIKIKKNQNRISQELKNNLYDLFSPDYVKTEAKYLLSLNVEKNVISTFTTISGASGRNKIILNVSYQLKDIKNLQEIANGKTIVSDNYNITSNRFASYTADDEITLNLTKIAAINIRNNLINDLNEYHKKQEKL